MIVQLRLRHTPSKTFLIDQIRPQSVRSTANRDRLVPIPWICTTRPKSPYTLAPEERIEVGNGGAHLANCLASAASFVVGRLELRHTLRRRPPGVPPRVEAEVPNAPAWSSATRFASSSPACSSLSWVDGWRPIICLAAERVLFCTFSHLRFILHARYAWSIGDDASLYSAPDPGILPLHDPLHTRLESAL
jgi:hypothetical protein